MARSSAYRWRNWRVDARTGQSIRSWKREKAGTAKQGTKPVSEKQLAYIRGLARQLGIAVPDGIATSVGASHVIEDLKRRREGDAKR